MDFPVNALDLSFNQAVMSMAKRCGGYRVSPNAPQTYEALCADYAANRVITVWDGASNKTIFGDPEVNFAFRAWHDYCHVWGAFDFSLQGETWACRLQQAHLRRFWGKGPEVDRWCDILALEIIGQRLFADANGGRFPDDQMAFTKARLGLHHLAA